jgi:hypothetical protein
MAAHTRCTSIDMYVDNATENRPAEELCSIEILGLKVGMHLCMQDDQNGQKTIVLTSAEETRLTCFMVLQNIFCSKQPSLADDGNTTCLGIQGKSSIFH